MNKYSGLCARVFFTILAGACDGIEAEMPANGADRLGTDVEAVKQPIFNAFAVSDESEERYGFVKVNQPNLETCTPNNTVPVPERCNSGSGSLLNSRYVMTASHVIPNDPGITPTTYTVRMGQQTRQVSRIWRDAGRDVAILQVHPPFAYAGGNRPLLTRNVNPGESVQEVGASPGVDPATGMGRVVRRDRPNHTVVFTVNTSNPQTFSWRFNPIPPPTTIFNESTYLGYGRQMSWYGDSGGPMLVVINRQFVLAGVEHSCVDSDPYPQFEECWASHVDPIRSWIDGIRNNHTEIYFPQPWSSPYPRNAAIDAPFDPGCPSSYLLEFGYDFECYWDQGHFYRHDNGQLEILSCSGTRSIVTNEPVHFAVFSDYSIERAGFTNVKATCF